MSALEENLWVIVQPAKDAPGQWLARCLNLDVVSTSRSLQGVLRTMSDAVLLCLSTGSAPRRRASRHEWALLEQLLQRGHAGEPPHGVEVAAAAELQLVRGPVAGSAVHSVRPLPWVWLERTALRAACLEPAVDVRAQRRAAWRAKKSKDSCGSARPAWWSIRGRKMSKSPEIIVTTQDFERLQRLVAQSDSSAAERLDAELARARLVAQVDVPADVVTMNSNVIYEDAGSGEQRAVRVVYPKDAEAARGWVSVLAPIGSALLGLRQGQEIEWPTPRGTRRLRVVAVPYQPESHGHFAL